MMHAMQAMLPQLMIVFKLWELLLCYYKDLYQAILECCLNIYKYFIFSFVFELSNTHSAQKERTVVTIIVFSISSDILNANTFKFFSSYCRATLSKKF